MNPSASGWIKKLLKGVSSTEEPFLNLSTTEFYNHLKQSGFIYGSNVNVLNDIVPKNDLSDEELCKVNLLLTFFYFYNKNPTKHKFIDSVINFYNGINENKTSFFESILGKKKSADLLEDIINKRVHIDDNIFTKNFNYFITNALLFIDILAYQKFLVSEIVSTDYIQQLEVSIETIVINVFDSKQKKSNYDESLVKLFEASRRYHNTSSLEYKDVIANIEKPLEKLYIFDLGCMASWTDKYIDPDEYLFLNQLGDDLNLSKAIIIKSIDDINAFYISNQDKIVLLGSKNMVQNFYDNSSKMVSKLISRNSKRLLKELRESKELMLLLTQSTTRDLSEEEQKKMQDQLLDIFKSIPSLAIFMLPGGAILLPLFVKFIPKLLPSAFDDNRIED